MSVQANLTDFDMQMVLWMRFGQCSCRPEMHMQWNEFQVPMHELDLAELAELSDLPVHRACSYCGRDTVAICRAAAVVPAERGLPALTHARMGDQEPVYALLDRGDSDDPEAAARARRLKNERGPAPLRVRGLERVALHADLCILATLASALARARMPDNQRQRG